MSAAVVRPGSRRLLALVVTAAALVAGCASPIHRAPVEDRTVKGRTQTPPPVAAASTPATPPAAGAIASDVPAPKPPPPGIENLGKPGYYAVKPGDTLIRIGLDSGQNWRDIMRWNNLENANVIEVGQVLRVVPPGTDPAVAVARPVAPTAPAATPAPVRPATGPAASASSAPGAVAAAPIAPSPAPAPAPSQGATASGGDDDINWTWPAGGPVLAGFDEARSKGLAIGGKAGDPVVAAADGRVVYAGSGLRGYGNLVIVKHNNTFLTAYAHNQTLLVKEDQNVRRGQRIAEMGSTDSERVQLHFEIRRQGRPVDPSRLLPSR